MTRSTLALGCLMAAWPTYAAMAADPDVVEKTVTGEGWDKDSCLKNALRKALEEGGKTEIYARSQVENFQLIKDTIVTRAVGIVKDYEVLKGPEEGVGGTWYVTIKAKISKKAIATAWGEVQNVLDQIGRPKVMVWIDEKIDGELDSSSILESKIEERLVKSGFDVYARKQIEAITKKESADAASEDNVAKVQALAKDFDCQLFIRGHSNANAAGKEDLYGVEVAFYNCDAMAKAYYTDTAGLLASESVPLTRRGARGHVTHSPQAAKVALGAAGSKIVDKLYETVMVKWATQITAGGEIRLEIEGIKAGPALKLKKAVAKIKGIEKINGPRLTRGIATYRIVAKMSAEQLAEHLIEGDWEKILEIVDIKLNRIQAKVKAGE